MSDIFKTIQADRADCDLALIEGDNEAAVIATDIGCWTVLVINHGADEPCELVREDFNSLAAAVGRVIEFLQAEYEGA